MLGIISLYDRQTYINNTKIDIGKVILGLIFLIIVVFFVVVSGGLIVKNHFVNSNM
jgi:hypothetical protein